MSGDYQKPKFVKEEVVASGKWLSLKNITYTNHKGKESTWESVARTTTKSNVDAVAVLAILKRTLHVDCIVCVKQYRPPLQAFTLEFPAGLVDEGENPENAALRELEEETGYTATIKHVSPATSLDGGVEDCKLITVTAEIDGDQPGNAHPKQNLGDEECIEVLVIPQTEFIDKLNALSKEGVVVDSRVYFYAIALAQCLKEKPAEIVEEVA